jgi:hypothetical protein
MDGADSSNLADTDYALQVTNNNTVKVNVMGNGAIGIGMVPSPGTMFAIKELGLLYYADNSSAINAGGLNPGDFYYSGSDPYQVCIVITPP